MTALAVVAIAALGGVGALARFMLDTVVQSRRPGEFPLGTFVVNLAGTFALGLLVGATGDRAALLLAGTATIGSFTTFSTWVFETHRLAQDGELRLAAVNLGLSLLAGLAVAAVGRAVGGLL